MTDSDEEPIPNDASVLRNKFPFSSTQYSVKNPNMAGFSFRNNINSSSLYERPKFSRQNFGGHAFDQRSAHNRRGTSPMSMVSESRRFNRDYSYCQSEMGGSIRSNDTICSAVDIADAIRNAKFNNSDLGIIKHALNNYYKNRSRRRIEKRRKLRCFFKYNNRKSGDDSGEQGSDSSLSSDDIKSTRSVKTLNPKNNILKPRNRDEIRKFNYLVKDNERDQYSENMKQSTFSKTYNDSSNNRLKGTTNRTTLNRIQEERVNKCFLLPSQRFTNKSISNGNLGDCKVLGFSFSKDKIAQKDMDMPRKTHDDSDSAQEEIFSDQILKGNGYSYSFLSKTVGAKDIRHIESDKNVQSLTMPKNLSSSMKGDFNFKKPQIPFRKQLKHPKDNVPEKLVTETFQQDHTSSYLQKQVDQMIVNNNDDIILKNVNKVNTNKMLNKAKGIVSNEETDSDEIFANITIQKNSLNNSSLVQKRPLEDSEKHCSERKRSKVAAPKTHLKKPNVGNANNNTEETQNFTNKDNENKNNHKNNSNIELNKDLNFYENTESQTNNNKSCFEKSSFMKRKLFTQKLDMLESKNLNGDNLTVNSPQVNHIREKNKVRKFATSQSYLCRDVCEDNVLELIHKIVPPDQMNLTNVTNKTSNRKSNLDEDKWDVASVISKCENGDFSDTFTDEEIFEVNNDLVKNKDERNEKPTNANIDSNKTCKVVVDKIPLQSNDIVSTISQTQNNNKKIKDTKCKNDRPQTNKEIIKPICNNVVASKRPATKMRSFWDTDSETDMEGRNEPLRKSSRNMDHDNEAKEVANKKPNETKSLRVAMLTLHNLKNSFISSVKKSPQLIPNQKINNFNNTDTSVMNTNQEITTQNKQTIKTVTETQNMLHKKKNLVSNSCKETNQNGDVKKKKEIEAKQTTVSKKRSNNNKIETKINTNVTVSTNKGSNKTRGNNKKDRPVTAKGKDVQVDLVQKKCSTAKRKPTQKKEKLLHNDSVSSDCPSILTRSLTRNKAENNNSIISNFNTGYRTRYGRKLLLDVSLSSGGEHSILTRSMRMKAQNISDKSINVSNSQFKPKQNLSKQNINKQNVAKLGQIRTNKKDKNNDASLKSTKNKYTINNNATISRTPRNKKNGLLKRNYH